jgi:hypothetical protein
MAATQISRAQLPATLTELGATAPTPGASDQAQLFCNPTAGNPTSLNYYWDNSTPPGQTFTTGSNPGNYVLSSVALKSNGGGGGGFATSQPFLLRIYSVTSSGTASNATLLAAYQSQSFSLATEGDWIQMTGLNLPLLANATYAYSFGRSSSGTGWENMGNTNGNPYPGGVACVIPPAGGTITFSGNTTYDAAFDLGMAPPTALTVAPPVLSTASPINQGTTVILTAGTVVGNSGAYTYQWQTDGGSGTLTNIPGATASTLSVNTTGMNLGVSFQYDVVVVDSSSATATSLPANFTLKATLSGTLADIGTTAPTVGGYDVYQLQGGQVVAGNLNYYYDNANPPGQTFTTGGNAKGYSMNSVSIDMAGGTQNSTTTAQGFDLFVYKISPDGTTATLMADITNLNFSFTYGHWLQWSFPSITLSSNTMYAYTFHRRSTGWAGLSTSTGGDVYPNGQICTIPSAGGTVTYSTTSGLDGTFDVGMVPIGISIIVNVPTATPNPAYALSPVTLSDTATGGIFTYRWLTDDGSGANPPNYISIPGATSTNLTVVPLDLNPGGADYTTNYYFVATVGASSSTSSVVTLTVHAASIPQFSVTPTPTNLVTFAGQGSVIYSVSEFGTLPITNQWQFNNGGGYASLTLQTNTTLTLTNLQPSASGTYQIAATNIVGTSNTAVTLTVLPAPAGPIAASQQYFNAVYTNHPWAYWRLNETNDPTAADAPVYTAYDYSGHGFDAVYGNAVTVDNAGPQTPTYPGFDANELAAGTTLATVNSYLTVPNLNLAGNSNLTFMAWINPNGPQPTYSGLFFNRGGPDSACGFGFGGTADHLGYTWNTNSAATYSWDSTLAVADYQWNFVAFVITPTNCAVYLGNLNGGTTNFLQANNPIAHVAETFNGGTIRLGSDSQSTTRTFGGLLAEMSLFTNALTSAQVQQYFLIGIGASALAPTVIAQASPSANVYSGQNVLLTGSATGTAPLTQQWQSSPDGSTWTDISGATGNNLLVNPFTVGTIYYQLVATNSAGSGSSGPIAVTFNVLPTTPAGLWTANFQIVNNMLQGNISGAGIGYYVGRGILGNGTYWNAITDTVTVLYTGINLASLSDLQDDGTTHSGIYADMYDAFGYSSLASPLLFHSDIGNLLDQYVQIYYSPAALQFHGVPDGTYNLAVYGADGTYDDRGTTFVVYDALNGNQTNSTVNAAPETALAEGVNFVIFTNVHVSGGTLTVDVDPNSPLPTHNPNTEADINGAQLQLVSYDVAPPAVTLGQTATGSSLALSWTEGILQTATNLMGPWTPVYSPSPISVTMTNSTQFFRVQVHQ